MSRQVKQEIDRATLPVPLARLLEQDDTRLIKQGAEAKVYRTTWFPDSTILVKHRFPKRYRHPTLDLELTRQRLTSEARSLVRCIKAGVAVPGLRCVDADAGVLGIEWVEGWSVREVLGGGQEDDALPDVDEEGVGNDETVDTDEHEEDVAALLRAKGVDEGKSPFFSLVQVYPRLVRPVLTSYSSSLSDEMLLSIGREIAKMHLAEIIHGDLTTSNMMVRLQTPAAPTPDTSSGTANSVDEEERIPGASRDARGRIGTGPAGFEVVRSTFSFAFPRPL
ncbi:hypothetical protein JCM10212_004926 [Sporobolomyces blumeae]